MLFKKISSLLNAILKNIFSGKDENKRNHMMAICTKTTLFSLKKILIFFEIVHIYVRLFGLRMLREKMLVVVDF